MVLPDETQKAIHLKRWRLSEKTFMIYGITNRDERTSILFHAKKRRSAKFAKV
jgi:hypothetical protein